MASLRLNARGLAAGALLISTACILACGDGGGGGGGGGTDPLPPSVARVDVSPPSGTVDVGSTLQFTATPRDGAGNALVGRSVSWSSGDGSVVSVGSSGLVTGVGPGATTVTATCEGKTVTPL
jgi:hypothetical protein